MSQARTARPLWAVLLLSAAAPAGAQAPAAPSAQVGALLQRHGIRPVSPPTPATDFTLPDLSGTEVRLSDSRGRWVLLTFFASWCGPCATEMPSLEHLHQARKGAGLEVLGVAIEPSRDKIAAFVNGKGVTFRVLVDASSQAASIYRAGSIPVSYLIDPSGNIVGVSRGARNWSASTGLIDDLVALLPPDPDATSSYQTAAAPVDLPADLEPPDATLEVAAEGLEAGEPFVLGVRVQWAGNFEDYLLLPPQVHVPEQVKVLGTSARTSSRDGRAVVTYEIRLQAQEPGAYALDPVELRYTPRLEPEPVARRIQGPTLQVGRATIAGLSPLALGGAMLGTLALGAGGAVALRRRKPGAPPAPADPDDGAALGDLLEAARRSRIQGDAAGCLGAIGRLQEKLGAPDPALGAALERVRYGGYSPPQHELDALLRGMERRLQDRKPRASARDDIKLKDG